MIGEILEKARAEGKKTLSEFESKKIIESLGIPITKESLARTEGEALKIAAELGYPVVLKGCSSKLNHKTEMGMVKLGLKSPKEVARAYREIDRNSSDIDGVLVQEMITGDREFVIGLVRDPQFGPCVMFGLGGVFTEVFKDVSFRVAPITKLDAEEMIEEIKTKKMIEEFRGSPKVDKDILIKALVGVGNLGYEHDDIAEIDINPLIVFENKPVAVDAMVVLV